MVLLAELLLAVGVLLGTYRLATRPAEGMAEAQPDRSPAERQYGPFTADDLAAMHIPMGFGYRKIDVDLLLDRLAQQLPRATYESTPRPALASPGDEPFPGVSRTDSDSPDGEPARDDRDQVSLTKEDDRG